MSEHNEPNLSAVHGGFSIERVLAASPHRVFQAFADPAAKALWFGSDERHTVLEPPRANMARPACWIV